MRAGWACLNASLFGSCIYYYQYQLLLSRQPSSSYHFKTFDGSIPPSSQDVAGPGRAWQPSSGALGDGGAGWPPPGYGPDPAYSGPGPKGSTSGPKRRQRCACREAAFGPSRARPADPARWGRRRDGGSVEGGEGAVVRGQVAGEGPALALLPEPPVHLRATV